MNPAQLAEAEPRVREPLNKSRIEQSLSARTSSSDYERGIVVGLLGDNGASGLTDSNFLRIRRSSIKLSAVTEHNTEPNMIITIISIGRELLPRL